MATSISLCLWIFLLCCFSKVAQGEVPVDCCLKVSQEKIPPHIVVGYSHQVSGYGCDINAVVFRTKKNRNLCAPPSALWVEDLISKLEKLVKRCKERNFRGQRCKGLRV